jgi:hypothetical protein
VVNTLLNTLLLFILLSFAFSGVQLFAGEADVTNVAVIKFGKSNYSFKVTIYHDDTGWDHYADKFEVIDENGTILGTRVLQHPYVNQKPFTRTLNNVSIPKEVKKVTIRAHDSVHEYGGKTMTVDLP